MKTVIVISLVCFPLFLSCAGRKTEPATPVATPKPPESVVLKRDVDAGSNEVALGQAADSSAPRNTRTRASSVAEKKAVRLAKGAAIKLLGSLERYEVITSELDTGWRVTVRLKDRSPLISGGITEFFVDKAGNRITDVKIYQ